MSGAMEPASIALRIPTSNSPTDGASGDRSITTAMMTGISASTVMISRRHRPESCRRVRR
jgi:hypothetical protein